MPPVVSSPSGSRSTLITWAVVFAILWVTATIFAIYFYADASKMQVQYDTQIKKNIPDIIAESEIQSDDVRKLKELRNQEGSGLNPQMSVFRAALTQRDQMAQMIAGAGGKDTALQTATSALQAAKDAGAKVKITLPATDNLAQALTTLANGLNTTSQQVTDLTGQLDAAKKTNADQAAQFDAARAEMNKNTEAIRAEQAKAASDLAAYQQTKDSSVGQIEQSRDQERKAAQDAQNNAAVQIAELGRQLNQANQKIETLQSKFGDRRVNTKDPVSRHPDGKILRIPAKDVVYIDLGTADSITPGLTFEVYDKIDGIPPIGDATTDDNLPKGKASIEVVRVGPGSSECRITRQTLGTQLVEGDLIANIVYDRNTKYNFVVYGDFDMDRNNVATPQEADVIRKLVTQWGGKLADSVNVDTDFVVLGKEPTLPTFTKEELQDPFNAKKLADAQAALDAYQNVKQTAISLHIPILNQNRFLYLIGYYDQGRGDNRPSMLTRDIRWRNPFEVVHLPPIARLCSRAYTAAAGMKQKLIREPFRQMFSLGYRFGMGGEGSLRLNVKGERRPLRFRARNLQFHSVYLPHNRHGSEPETAALLDALVGPNDVFYDVGSNWGYYSLYIASRDDFAGQVHAFEPMPGTFGDLQSVVQQAGLETQITCHQVGASDAASAAHMSLPDGIHSGMAAVSESGVDIKLNALDLMGLPLPAVIKMDVEGHEIKALNGARKILTDHKPMLVFESWLHNDKPHETLGPFELLKSMGYIFFEPAFYLRDGNGAGFAIPGSGELREDQLSKLALFEFEPRERFLLGMLFNVLACHVSQRGKLESLFTPAT